MITCEFHNSCCNDDADDDDDDDDDDEDEDADTVCSSGARWLPAAWLHTSAGSRLGVKGREIQSNWCPRVPH